ncbi:ATP binding, partial [Dipsacomyces acuminosporus]
LDYALLKELSVRTVGERVRLNLAIRKLRQQCFQEDAENDSSHRMPRFPNKGSIFTSPKSTAISQMSNVAPMSLPPSHSTGNLSTAAMLRSNSKELPVLPQIDTSETLIGSRSSARTHSAHELRTNRPYSNFAPAPLRHANSINEKFSTMSINQQQRQQQQQQQAMKQKYRLENAAASQLPNFTLKTGLSPKNPTHSLDGPPLPSPRLRMLTSSHSNVTIPSSLQQVQQAQQQQQQQTQQQQQPSPPPPQQAQHEEQQAPPQQQQQQQQQKKSKEHGTEEQKTPTSTIQPEDIDRLEFAFQEIFGTDISVSSLADSLSLKSRKVSIVGPENQVRLVSMTNTRSAQDILDRVLREFNLDTDIDKDRYSLFSMTSKTGGARCLTDDELLEIFSDPEGMSNEKLFLRKRHQLSKPSTGSKRSENLQRTIQKLGNIIPMQGLYGHQQQQYYQQQQQQQQPHHHHHQQQQQQQLGTTSNPLSVSPQTAVESASTAVTTFNPSPSSPHTFRISPTAASDTGRSNRESISSVWSISSKVSTDKLTRLLGERPPSELVSRDVEKYFPGNEARARYSIMRRRRRESQIGASDPSIANVSRSSSVRQTRLSRHSSTSSHAKQGRVQSYVFDSDNRLPNFAQQLPPMLESIDEYTATSSMPPLPPSESNASVSALADPDTDSNTQQQGRKSTDVSSKRMSKIFLDPVVEALRNASKESVVFSDIVEEEFEDDYYNGSLSDIPSSGFSSPFDSAGSFSGSQDESANYSDLDDIDDEVEEMDAGNAKVGENGAAKQGGEGSESRASISAVGRASVASGIQQLGGDQTGTFSSSISKRIGRPGCSSKHRSSSVTASERRMSRSGTMASRSSRVHSKKKSWIKGAPIASGSFGSVYFGMQTRTGAIMAVKEVELPQPGSVSAGRKQRMADALRHELSLLQGLDHKNIVKYLGSDMDDSHLYIFLEYVPGGSIASMLASFGQFPEPLVQIYTAQILDGLVYLHNQGIIHRDIKGGNVLVDKNGCAKISDFGISKRVDEAAVASKIDKRVSLQGSVFWMAPEVVKDTRYTFKGDIWSLGCLVVEMMTGSHPFPDLDQMQALYTIGQMGRPKIPGDISAAGQLFLEQVLELDVEKRPSASELCSHEFVLSAAVYMSSP